MGICKVVVSPSVGQPKHAGFKTSLHIAQIRVSSKSVYDIQSPAVGKMRVMHEF